MGMTVLHASSGQAAHSALKHPLQPTQAATSKLLAQQAQRCHRAQDWHPLLTNDSMNLTSLTAGCGCSQTRQTPKKAQYQLGVYGGQLGSILPTQQHTAVPYRAQMQCERLHHCNLYTPLNRGLWVQSKKADPRKAK